MAKFLSRLLGPTKKEMHIVLMKVLAIEIPVKETVSNISIQWTRGDFSIASKNKYELKPEAQNCEMKNEMFVKLSAFYRNSTTGKYQSKSITISI